MPSPRLRNQHTRSPRERLEFRVSTTRARHPSKESTYESSISFDAAVRSRQAPRRQSAPSATYIMAHEEAAPPRRHLALPVYAAPRPRDARPTCPPPTAARPYPSHSAPPRDALGRNRNGAQPSKPAANAFPLRAGKSGRYILAMPYTTLRHYRYRKVPGV